MPIVRSRQAMARFVFRDTRCHQRGVVKFSYLQPRRFKALAQYGPKRARHWSLRLRADGVGLTNSSPIFRQRPKALRSEKDAAPGRSTLTISLAFLAPNLVKAAIEGRLPHGMG